MKEEEEVVQKMVHITITKEEMKIHMISTVKAKGHKYQQIYVLCPATLVLLVNVTSKCV